MGEARSAGLVEVRRWISPSAGLKVDTTRTGGVAFQVRRWISPSAGLKGLVSGFGDDNCLSQKMDKPECGIESPGWWSRYAGRISCQKMDKPECGIERAYYNNSMFEKLPSEDG